LSSASPRSSGLGRVIDLWRLFRREKTDPEPFYRALAAEAVIDLEERHGPFTGRRILDMGCGPGFYTDAFRARGAEVVPIDNDPTEMAMVGDPPEGAIVADAGALPLEDRSFDGVFCSNLLEHTPQADPVIEEMQRVLKPGGWGYVSWTNWWSPWGGHDMTPWHYLGPRLGPRLYEHFKGLPRKNPYGAGLWARHVGPTVRLVRSQPLLQVDRVEPRYWPRLAFICDVPVLRELATWNCVIRVTRKPG